MTKLVFANRHHQVFDWPEEDIIGTDNPPTASYPDSPANMPGVHLNLPSLFKPPTQSSPSDDSDWAQLAEDALANANINNMDVLPTPPEVTVIDDDDDVPLSLHMKQTFDYLPKIKPDEVSFVTSLQCLPQPYSTTKPTQTSG